MQKKSLLVALFCGALCLTGCLKNEVSPSVEQVRIAKAAELNSIATLNNAKAAAEAVYAQAELTLKNAQAKLLEAQSETEKVRAELLKVKVQLLGVKVEEEQVELLKKQAELEVLLAQAEAAKQYWANKLEQLLADAELATIENQAALIAAQAELENYILTLEGSKADSARVYASKYFRAQNKVAELQAAELAAKAARVLLENNATSTRQFIYDEMGRMDDSIAVNNAKIEALKKYQTVDPETAKKELATAWEELNVAYNDWKTKVAAETAAKNAYDKDGEGITKKTAEFIKKDNKTWAQAFGTKVTDLFPTAMVKTDYDYEVKVGEKTETVKATGIVVPTEEDETITEFIPFWTAQKAFDEFERYPSSRKDVAMAEGNDYVVLTTTTYAPAGLYADNIDEAMDKHVEVYKDQLDKKVADFQEELNDLVEGTETTTGWKEEIANNKEKIALHKQYIDARKATVEAAEKNLITELGKEKAYKAAKEEAWKAFQEYMVLKYDVSRKYFIARNKADSAYVKAAKDTVEAYKTWAGIIEGTPTLQELVVTEFEAFIEAEGEYRAAYQASQKPAAVTAYENVTAAETKWNKEFDDAVKAGAEVTFEGYDPLNTAQVTIPQAWTATIPATETTPAKTIYAKSTQNDLLTAQYNLVLAENALYKAKEDLVRYPEGTSEHAAMVTAKNDAETLVSTVKESINKKVDGYSDLEAAAAKAYTDAVSAYNELIGTDLAEAKEAFNKDFPTAVGEAEVSDIFTVCKFPTEARPNEKYSMSETVKFDKDNLEWYTGEGATKQVAGTAQAALLFAVDAVVWAENQVKKTVPTPSWPTEVTDLEKDPTKYTGWKDYTAWQQYAIYEARFEEAEDNLYIANRNLMDQLGVDFDEVQKEAEEAGAETPAEIQKYLEEYVAEHIGEYKDTKAEELYRAYKNVENKSEVTKARTALRKAYSFNPDMIDMLWWNMPNPPYGTELWHPNDDWYRNGKVATFGWLKSSYEVDPEATMVDETTGESMLIADYLFTGHDSAKSVAVSAKYEDGKFKVEEKTTWYDKNGKEVTAASNDSPVFSNSLTFKTNLLQKKVDSVPGLVKEAEEIAKNKVADEQTKVDGIMETINSYKAHENGYKTWLAECGTVQKALNEAKKAAFDAKVKKNAAMAKYEAIDAVVNGGVWVYDKDWTIFDDVYGKDAHTSKAAYHENDFTKISIEDAIAAIEKENKAIEARKHQYQLDLKYGKLTYQTVMEVLDETIAVLESDIEIWVAIANQYAAVMYGYLGIVDDDVVEEEGDEE